MRIPLSLWILSTTLCFSRLQAAGINDLDAFVAQKQKQFQIPGIAVGVVQHGKLIYARGFGYRDRDQKLPVTPRTVFGIGSTSKAFTGILGAMLVDEGKLAWDRPVKSDLQDFQLSEPTAANSATLRDLLTHQTGQQAHDMMWLGSPFSRNEIFSRLGFFETNLNFRQKWNYSNLMFMAAGHLEERVAGKSWEKLMKERIFQALGMKSSNTSTYDSEKLNDFSYPYRKEQGKLVIRNFRRVDNMGPAASVNTNIEDMAEWLKFQLSGADSNGRALLSRTSFLETHRPQVKVPDVTYDKFPEFTPSEYAFAWTVQRYRGTLIQRHGGSIGGFLSTVAVLPELDAGVVVLQNFDEFGLNSYVALRAFDLLLGKKPIDWISRINGTSLASVSNLENEFNREEKLFYSALPALTVETNEEPEALNEYTGTFENAGYGILKTFISDGKLKLTYNDFTLNMSQKKGDEFSCLGWWDGRATFKRNTSGKVISVQLPWEAEVGDIVFHK